MKGEPFYDPRTELPTGERIEGEGAEGLGDVLDQELNNLAAEHDNLELQLAVLQEQSELPPEQREFFGVVGQEAESLGGVLSSLGRTGGLSGRLRRGAILAAGIIGITLMSGREAKAGGLKLNLDNVVRAAENVVTTFVRNTQETKQEKLRQQGGTDREKERTTQIVGSEDIRKERDVTLGAMKVEKPTSIKYVSGGKEVTVDIAKGAEEKQKLEAENAALLDQIRILKLRLENEQLEQQKKELEQQKEQLDQQQNNKEDNSQGNSEGGN